MVEGAREMEKAAAARAAFEEWRPKPEERVRAAVVRVIG